MNEPHGSQSLESDDPSGMRMIDGATVDTGRTKRCGFGEVIYGEGKDADLISRISKVLLEKQDEVLVTRIAEDDAKLLLDEFSVVHHHESISFVGLSFIMTFCLARLMRSFRPSNHL